MRRLTLSTKLFAAALPILVAVVALLALTVRSDLQTVQRAESGAELGEVWQPLIATIDAIEAEVASIGGAPMPAGTENQDPATLRRTTDQAINTLRESIDQLGAARAAGEHITASRSALSAARRTIDLGDMATQMQADTDPLDAYDLAGREIVAVGQLLPAEAGDADLGRELLAVVKLAESKLAANEVVAQTTVWAENPADRAPLLQARSAFSDMESSLSEFAATAPDEWAAQYRQSGYTTALSSYRADLDTAVRDSAAGREAGFDTAGFADLVEQGVTFQQSISQSIVDQATAQVDEVRRAALIRIGVILGAVLLAALIAAFIVRSITRRVRAVATGANQVADEQLPALVEALRDPRGNAVLPDIEPLKARGGDELAELARSFNSMQSTLVEVASEQVEVLRRGVSDIFVTMARRNRSLIDRQLAMLDEYEAECDEPDILSHYYQLDHLATRMRRNSESLLVLANAEPKRRRVKATEIDDVVRASIGEVEDYRRVQIEALESLQVRGNVVADVSHLLAELLDNATSFSPPDSPVRVGGRRTGDSYMLRIVDDGVGVGPERLHELNDLLAEPPVIGLSASTTLGISVVSLLANKHGIGVTLSSGNPGLTVDVVLPSTLFGPIEETYGGAMPSLPGAVAPAAPGMPVAPPEMSAAPPVTATPQYDVAEYDAPAEATAQPAPAAPAPAATPGFDDDAPRVVASDWTRISADLSAFRSGMQSATEQSAAEEPAATAEQPEPEPGSWATQPDPAPLESRPAPADDPYADPFGLRQPDPEPQVAPADEDAAIAGALDAFGADAVPSAAAPPAPAAPPAGFADPQLPPPPAIRHGEFDVPPAPPVTADGPSRSPVSPVEARPAPRLETQADTGPALPTRSPGAQTAAGGPDRLAEAPPSGSEPGALSAALAAFDAPHTDPTDDLPTRAPGFGSQEPIDEPSSISQSRLDPEALRERLRSFQSEFATGQETGPDPQTDLGGDPR
jgi:signal transduction histidine kinase